MKIRATGLAILAAGAFNALLISTSTAHAADYDHCYALSLSAESIMLDRQKSKGPNPSMAAMQSVDPKDEIGLLYVAAWKQPKIKDADKAAGDFAAQVIKSCMKG